MFEILSDTKVSALFCFSVSKNKVGGFCMNIL